MNISLRPFCLFMITLSLNSLSFAAQESRSIQNKLANLEASSGGRLGIAAINTGNNEQIEYRGKERFPMGCTSKVIGVAAILKKSMTNKALMQERVSYSKKDLTNWTPITEKHVNEGMTVEALSAAAISYSDNTAMNLLAQKLGGVQGLNSFARSIGDQVFKLDHTWPDEALATPESHEDSTTPNAMTKSLQKIALGNVLSAEKREQLLSWMKNNVTGNARIRAGVPKGWVVGDKTGTGFYYGTTNDTAIIWPPKCAPIIVTIYYSHSQKQMPKREDILASSTKFLLEEFAKHDHCMRLSSN